MRSKQMSTPAYIAMLVTASVVVIVIAIFIGRSDDGVINVNDAIDTANQANISANGDASNNVETVPSVFQRMENGGLVPQENPPAQPEPIPAPVTDATTTATTTPPTEGETPSEPEGEVETPTTESSQ